MYRLKKWTFCGKKDSTDSPEANNDEVSVQTTFTRREIVYPKYWIDYDDDNDKDQTVAIGIHLPGCSRDRISVRIWNSKHLIVNAVSEFQFYELEYEFPPGARLLCTSWLVAKEVLTCRYHAPNPVCIVCKGSIASDPFIETQELLANAPVVDKLSSRDPSKGLRFELLKPQFWITYDDKEAALLKVHLKGCRSPTQINFSVDNYEVRIQAYLNAPQVYMLKLRLNASAKPGWTTHFNEKVEMFTCSIPLVGHFECRKCTPVQHIKTRANKNVDWQTINTAAAAPQTTPRPFRMDKLGSYLNNRRKQQGPSQEELSKSICSELSLDFDVLPVEDETDTVEILATATIMTVD